MIEILTCFDPTRIPEYLLPDSERAEGLQNTAMAEVRL